MAALNERWHKPTRSGNRRPDKMTDACIPVRRCPTSARRDGRWLAQWMITGMKLVPPVVAAIAAVVRELR